MCQGLVTDQEKDWTPVQGSPQMPDALGGMRSGKSTAWRGWTGCGITETLRALITLKGPQWSQRFQWSQWFGGRAQIDEPVGEPAMEDWLRAIAIRPDDQSGVVFSARDLQRGERGKATCVSRAGGFLLPKEAKCGIVCQAV
jgi:hypothetical protein